MIDIKNSIICTKIIYFDEIPEKYHVRAIQDVTFVVKTVPVMWPPFESPFSKSDNDI